MHTRSRTLNAFLFVVSMARGVCGAFLCGQKIERKTGNTSLNMRVNVVKSLRIEYGALCVRAAAPAFAKCFLFLLVMFFFSFSSFSSSAVYWQI